MRKAISELLRECAEQPTKKDRIEYLRAIDNKEIRYILTLAYDPSIKWALPEGDPPYKPCIYPDQEGLLYGELRRLYLFLEGGNPNLTPMRREQLFVSLLESVYPLDAVLLCGIKDGKVPFKNFNKQLAKEALAGFLADEQVVQEEQREQV